MEQFKQKEKFRLSKSNWIYYSFYVAVFELTKLFWINDFAYGLGGISAGIVISLGISVLISWVFWRLSGKNKKVAIITFNIVLTLFVILAFNQCRNRQEQRTELERLDTKGIVLKELLSKNDESVEIDSSISDYLVDINRTFANLAEKSTGDEKLLFIRMNEFLDEQIKHAMDYMVAFDSIFNWRMFNLMLLNNDKEFDYQRSVIINYINTTNTLHVSYNRFIKELKDELSDISDMNIKNEVLQGALDSYNVQKPTFNQYMEVNLQYGNTMLDLLDLYQENMKAWEYIDGFLNVKNDKLELEINNIYDKITRQEYMIDSLRNQLLL